MLKLVGVGSVSIINKLLQMIRVQTKLQDLSVPWQGKIILMDGRIRKLSKEEEKCSIICVLSFVEEALFWSKKQLSNMKRKSPTIYLRSTEIHYVLEIQDWVLTYFVIGEVTCFYEREEVGFFFKSQY